MILEFSRPRLVEGEILYMNVGGGNHENFSWGQ